MRAVADIAAAVKTAVSTGIDGYNLDWEPYVKGVTMPSKPPPPSCFIIKSGIFQQEVRVPYSKSGFLNRKSGFSPIIHFQGRLYGPVFTGRIDQLHCPSQNLEFLHICVTDPAAAACFQMSKWTPGDDGDVSNADGLACVWWMLSDLYIHAGD